MDGIPRHDGRQEARLLGFWYSLPRRGVLKPLPQQLQHDGLDEPVDANSYIDRPQAGLSEPSACIDVFTSDTSCRPAPRTTFSAGSAACRPMGPAYDTLITQANLLQFLQATGSTKIPRPSTATTSSTAPIITLSPGSSSHCSREGLRRAPVRRNGSIMRYLAEHHVQETTSKRTWGPGHRSLGSDWRRSSSAYRSVDASLLQAGSKRRGHVQTLPVRHRLRSKIYIYALFPFHDKDTYAGPIDSHEEQRPDGTPNRDDVRPRRRSARAKRLRAQLGDIRYLSDR